VGEDAAERRLLLSVTSLTPRHPSEVRHVLVGEDLTDYKRLEAELRQAERLSSLGQLSAGMAHQIRNPLAGIAMTAQVLQARLGDRPDADPYLARIQTEIQRLERIVRSLLEFSRPARPQLAPLDLAASARRVLEDLAGQASAGGIELAPLDGAAPLPALADGDQIHQVLLNLVQNALQACQPGDRVGISLERAAAVGGADRVQLRVWDSGPGVPEAARSRLFEPFFTTKAEGTGLGLAVCRQILEEHGGRIRYRPRAGGGAEFCLELGPVPGPPLSEEPSA
jgi:signal transduction histidine kinase